MYCRCRSVAVSEAELFAPATMRILNVLPLQEFAPATKRIPKWISKMGFYLKFRQVFMWLQEQTPATAKRSPRPNLLTS